MGSQYTPYQQSYYVRQPPYASYYAYDRNALIQQQSPVRSQSYNDIGMVVNNNVPYHLRQVSPSYSPMMSVHPPTPRGSTSGTFAKNCADPNNASAVTDGPPTISPRYRGKHSRAASTGSIPASPNPAASTANLAPIEYPITLDPAAHTGPVTPHQMFHDPPTVKNISQQHHRGYNSLSSSNASIDSDSTRTQTSVSSIGSVHSGSWSDDENKQKQTSRPQRQENLHTTKNGSTIRVVSHGSTDSKIGSATMEPALTTIKSRGESPSAEEKALDAAKQSSEDNRLSPNVSPKSNPSQKRTSASSRKQEAPSPTTSSKSLVLPSDLRPRSFVLASEDTLANSSNQGSEDLKIARVRRESRGESSQKTNERSYPVDTRSAARIETRRASSSSETIRASSSSGNVSIQQQQPQQQQQQPMDGERSRPTSAKATGRQAPLPFKKPENSGGFAPRPIQKSQSTGVAVNRAPNSAPATAPATATSAAAEVPEPPKVRKSQSFSEKLRSYIGLKSKDDFDGDAKSIRSTKSSRSMSSIRSTASTRSFMSRFSRNKKDEQLGRSPSTEFTPLGTAQTAKSRRSQSVTSLSQNRMSVAENSRRQSFVVETVRPPTPVLSNNRSSNPSVRTKQEIIDNSLPIPVTPKAIPRSGSKTDVQPATDEKQNHADTAALGGDDKDSLNVPRPPSPALRSVINADQDLPSPIHAELPSVDSIIDDTNNQEHLAPTNLGAGDIFPGSLEPQNIETIVSSVERTGSFKRQPSLSRRTKDERVPNEHEVEVEKPEETAAVLVSAMKQGETRRRRSGAMRDDSRKVHFASQISVYKTYSSQGYDRTPDRMTCDRLSEPGMAQRLREESNHWKSLMPVHPSSVSNTQFFHN